MRILAYKKRVIIFLIIAAIAVWCGSCRMRGYYSPKWEKKDILAVLDKKELGKADYDFLFSQTGLGKSAVDELISSGRGEELYGFAEQYFEKPEYDESFMFFPIVITEQKEDFTEIAPLHKGDVLVSLTTHTLGFRHGHAGIVINGETGKTLEHMVLGQPSQFSNVSGWRGYPTFAVLRYKDSEIAAAAADYAEKNLTGLVYNPLAGIIKKDKSDENPLSWSHCSHLVWQAYFAAGADIDGNGGQIVLPKDILSCPDMEIVQIYGINPEKYKNR